MLGCYYVGEGWDAICRGVILCREDMHMTLFRVRDGFISAQVSEIFHEPLGE